MFLAVWFPCDEELDLAWRKGESISYRDIARGYHIVQDHASKSSKTPWTYDCIGRLQDERSGKMLSAEQIGNSPITPKFC